MKLHPLNYLNLVFWCSALVLPFLAQEIGLIDTQAFLVSKENGWDSIFTGVFLHSSYSHLMGNFTGILLGTSILLNFQRKMYLQVILYGLFLPPLLGYFAGERIVGISGLAYTLIWYIIFRGLMSRDRVRFAIGILTLVFYGATAKGIIPQSPLTRISWLTHLGGFLVAFNLALYQRLTSMWRREL